MSTLSRVMRKRLLQSRLATRDLQGPYRSTRIFSQARVDEQPMPTDDELIKIHYLKHHPLYEYRQFEEFHVDNYRHWLHARVDYWNTESDPASISPWNMGSKFWNSFYIVFPFVAFYLFSATYKTHLKNKNVHTPIVSTCSQISI